MKRTYIRLTDDRFKGLRTHTKEDVAICPAIRTTVTGWLWWRKKTTEVVYAVMLAEEDDSYDPFCSPFSDYHWRMVNHFKSFEMAKDFKNKLIFK